MSWKAEVLESAGNAARGLRIGMEALASDRIVALSQALAGVPEENLHALDELFGAIATAQERRDHLRVADLLEFELPRALAGIPT